MKKYVTIKNATYAFYVSMVFLAVGVLINFWTMTKVYKKASDCIDQNCDATLDNLEKNAHIGMYLIFAGIAIALLAMVAVIYINKISHPQLKKASKKLIESPAKPKKKTATKKKTS